MHIKINVFAFLICFANNVVKLLCFSCSVCDGNVSNGRHPEPRVSPPLQSHSRFARSFHILKGQCHEIDIFLRSKYFNQYFL
jgi:hypothetical protein